MNSMQVKDKLKSISKEKNVNFNIMLKFYVFDRFVVRLAKSEYKDNFIIKGGFLLGTLFGVEARSTMDIDASITKIMFGKKQILKMINAIISIDLDDNIKFEIKGVNPIREEDEYGGYRIYLNFLFENIKEVLKIDVATGDVITPKAIIYQYKLLLDNKYVSVWAYNIETVLAEKIESVFSKVELTSRMKDYYDIYLICSRNWNEIDKATFKIAVNNTFQKRNFDKNLKEIFLIIKNSILLKERWTAYIKQYDYVKNIEFEDILKWLEKIIEILV